ncbi:uncharacterized protein [Malus domestica]|uniref:uncharacterized protein n=1 Tax=Malus domestica TaxID=3750 RepID=UPI0039747A20
MDAVLSVVDPAKPEVVDLRDIRITKKLRGTVDDTETVKGLVFDKKASYAAGGPTRMKNAKIAVIQFQTMTSKKKTKYVVVEDDDNDMANKELLSVEKLFGNQSCKKLYQKLQTTKFKRKVRIVRDVSIFVLGTRSADLRLHYGISICILPTYNCCECFEVLRSMRDVQVAIGNSNIVVQVAMIGNSNIVVAMIGNFDIVVQVAIGNSDIVVHVAIIGNSDIVVQVAMGNSDTIVQVAMIGNFDIVIHVAMGNSNTVVQVASGNFDSCVIID